MKLQWDRTGDRLFEAGLDRGVLYPGVVGQGVPWNGLISVDTAQDGKGVTPLYFEGVKSFDLVTPGDFTATLKAVTYPDEFIPFDGYAEFANGMFFDDQPVNTFGLSYRTFIGNDQKGTALGYKLHILYNLTAIADTINHQSLTTNVEPVDFSWSLTSVPEFPDGFRPTAHIILDSREVDYNTLKDLETILYGDEDNNPRIVTMSEFNAFIGGEG